MIVRESAGPRHSNPPNKPSEIPDRYGGRQIRSAASSVRQTRNCHDDSIVEEATLPRYGFAKKRPVFAMDGKVQTVLDHYDQRAAAEAILMDQLSLEEITRRVDEFLISIGPDAGTLLNVLIKAMRSPTVVELGTSYGHPTVFFAEAARASAGRRHLYRYQR